MEEFLSDLKEKFSGKDNKMMKVVKLKKIEQESKTMEKFVQEFIKATRSGGYDRRLLVKKFKRIMNEVI